MENKAPSDKSSQGRLIEETSNEHSERNLGRPKDEEGSLDALLPVKLKAYFDLNAGRNPATTMLMYEVLNLCDSRVCYRTTYFRDSAKGSSSTWKSSEFGSSQECVSKKQADPSVKVYNGRPLPSPKESAKAIVTVEDINTNKNWTCHNLSYIVYTGKSLDQVETVIRQDRSKTKEFCHKVDIVYVPEDAKVYYDVDSNDVSSVLYYKNSLELAYYNGKTYRKYSLSYKEINGDFNSQFRCNHSMNCLAELSLRRDESQAVYALRFEQHTCSSKNHTQDDDQECTIKCDLLEFYNTLNNACFLPSSKPSVYFHGYLYDYLQHLSGHREFLDLELSQQHVYKCKSPDDNNCSACLLFCNLRGTKNFIFKIGDHTCKLEVEESGKVVEKDEIDMADDKCEDHSRFSLEQGTQPCDVKKLLESSIEINQEIDRLKVASNINRHDLDNYFTNTCSSSVEGDVEGSQNVNYCESVKNTKLKTPESRAIIDLNPISKIRHLEPIQHDEEDVKSEEKTHGYSTAIDLKHISESKSLKKFRNVEEDYNVKGQNLENKIPISLDEEINVKQGSEKTQTTETVRYSIDLLTRKPSWKYISPVTIKNLGHIMGHMPQVDPDDWTTAYSFTSYDARPRKKMIHYMGYNFRKRSKTSYRCITTNLCSAMLSIKNKTVGLLGPHTCKSLIDARSKTTRIESLPDNDNNTDGVTFEIKGDIANNQFKDDTVCSRSSIEIKQEDDIDITENGVGNTEIKIENEEKFDDINGVNDDICFIRNINAKGDAMDVDSEAGLCREYGKHRSTSLNKIAKNKKGICKGSSDSDLILHFGIRRLVAYKGYEYRKERSGKYAWCIKSKICSGMIKILPDDKGELIGRHTCTTSFEEKGTSALDVDDIDCDDGNDNNEDTVQVEIKTISDIPREMKSVLLGDQVNYKKTPSGQGLQFGGYTFKKYWESGDISTFTCVHKRARECPGMVQMFQDKIVRSCDHVCTGVENLNFLATQCNRNTVLMYLNRQKSKPEAMYQGFTYRRTSRTNHVSVWKCTNIEANCTASIKIFTFTSTLSEDGRHICILKSDVWVSNVKNLEVTTSKNFIFPVYSNKSVIPVYNDKDEINLIYQGYIYRGGGSNWACIQRGSKGCKGLLRILSGDIMHASNHSCFKNKESSSTGTRLQNKYSSYTEFLSNIASTSDGVSPEDRTKDLHFFLGSNYREFCMYEGYVYKKLRTFKNDTVYKWICENHVRHRCEGVLTTEKYKVLAISQHVCRQEHISSAAMKGRGKNTKTAETIVDNTTQSLNKDSTVVTIPPSKKLKQYTRKAKRNKLKCSEEDIEAQIPSVIIEQAEVVQKYMRNVKNVDIILLSDEDSNPMKVKSESHTKGDDAAFIDIEEKFPDSEDSKNSILPVKEEIIDDYQYDKGAEQQLELFLEEEDYKQSTIKEENLDCEFGSEAVSTVKEEPMEWDFGTEAENISMALSRGPNGEYFVHNIQD